MPISNYTGDIKAVPFVAGGTLATTSAGLFVVANSTTGKVTVNTTAKGDCVGVLGTLYSGQAVDGDKVPVIVYGIVEIQAGGTIVAGDLIASNNAGKAVKFADGFIMGRALSSGANNSVVTVQLFSAFKPA